MRMIKVCLLDLDDTLYSEYDYVLSGFDEVSKYLSKKTNLMHKDIFDGLVRLFDLDKLNVFDRFLISNYVLKEKVDISEILDVYRSHVPTIELFDDSKNFLDYYKNSQIKLGLITDGRPLTQNNKIQALGISRFFKKIIITDELGVDFRKPHPYAFEVMKDYFSVDFDEMIYIGDNPVKDFYIKSIYDIKTIRIKRNHGFYKDMPYLCGVKEDETISSLIEAIKLIQE